MSLASMNKANGKRSEGVMVLPNAAVFNYPGNLEEPMLPCPGQHTDTIYFATLVVYTSTTTLAEDPDSEAIGVLGLTKLER